MRNRRSFEPSWTKRSRSRNRARASRPILAVIVSPPQSPLLHAPMRATLHHSYDRSSPSPQPRTLVAHRGSARVDTDRGWLTNSTVRFREAGRVCLSHAVKREGASGCSEPDSSKISLCAAQHSEFFAALAFRRFGVRAAAGHAVPTRRELSARRVYSDTIAVTSAPVRGSKPTRRPARLFFLRPVRQAAGLEPRQSARPATSGGRTVAPSASEAASCRATMRDMLGLPSTPGSGSCPGPTPAPLKWRCGRCSAPPGDDPGVGRAGAGWVTDAAKQLQLDAETAL